MKAVTYSTFGSANEVLQIESLNDPIAGEGDVVVKMHYSAVNPSDVKARAGGRPGITKPPFAKIIPNSDGSGIIVDVGHDVDKNRIGQRVWLWNGQWKRAFGTSAEYIALPQEQAVLLPDNVDLREGAILGIPALTAVHAVIGQGNVKGKHVFISGGAGTVGRLAIQAAKALGANVIATAGGKLGIDSAKTAGADLVLDYHSKTLVEETLEFTQGKLIDKFIEVEFGKNIAMIAKLITENGSIASFGSSQEMTPKIPFYPLMFKAVNIEFILVYLLQSAKRQKAIEILTQLLKANVLDFQIDSEFDFNNAVDAHERIESGKRNGSVLLNICKT